MSTFWELDPAVHLDRLPAANGWKAEPINRSAAPRCPCCGLFIGMLVWEPPFLVELELFANRWEDRVLLPGREFLVSAAFVHMYTGKGSTGLTPFRPVEVVRINYRTKSKPEPPTYYMTKVLKSDARVDDAASQLRRNLDMPWCRYCGGSSETFRERLVLESKSWRGEDWFEPQNLSKTLVTDRVVQAISETGLSGFHFERCENAKYREHWPRDAQGNRLPL